MPHLPLPPEGRGCNHTLPSPSSTAETWAEDSHEPRSPGQQNGGPGWDFIQAYTVETTGPGTEAQASRWPWTSLGCGLLGLWWWSSSVYPEHRSAERPVAGPWISVLCSLISSSRSLDCSCLKASFLHVTLALPNSVFSGCGPSSSLLWGADLRGCGTWFDGHRGSNVQTPSPQKEGALPSEVTWLLRSILMIAWWDVFYYLHFIT